MSAKTLPTEKQLRFIESLLNERPSLKEAPKLEGFRESRKIASEAISWLLDQPKEVWAAPVGGETQPPTEKQLRFIESLLSERPSLKEAPELKGFRESRKIASGAISWLLEQPKEIREPDVPAGHYAVPSVKNNDLDFYRVDRPEEGKWAGRTFVKTVVGGRPDERVSDPRERRTVLVRILSVGIENARQKYGQEIGQCYICNRHLTDELSRRRGIGPDCWEKYG